MPKILIGSDPEFVLGASYTKKIPARLVYGSGTELGVDGNDDIGELRPNPGTPTFHLKQIRKLIMRHNSQNGNMLMFAGSYQFEEPIGGHIHLSGFDSPKRPLAACLDEYLGIPLLMLEAREAAKNRRETYGRLGDFRDTAYDSYALEWRVPSSWLVSMEVAKMVLNIAYVIALNARIMERGKFFDVYSPSIRKAFNHAEKEKFYPEVINIVRSLYKLPQSSAIFNSIRMLELLVTNKQRWHQELQVVLRWKIDKKIHLNNWVEDLPLAFSHDYAISPIRSHLWKRLKDSHTTIEKYKYYIYGVAKESPIDGKRMEDISIYGLHAKFNFLDFLKSSWKLKESIYGNANSRAVKEFGDSTPIVCLGISRYRRNENLPSTISRKLHEIIMQLENQ